eukprot:evm.model.scf_505.5 EVM.evm.TU.scf_505.5   scf_505:53290-54805(+)
MRVKVPPVTSSALSLSPFPGNGPPRILVNVGRITTVALTFLTFMWLPVIQASQQSLYIVAQNAMTHVAPPVTAIFLAALLWRRANGEGALAALAAGSITGGIRLVVTMMSQDYCSSFVDPVTRVIACLMDCCMPVTDPQWSELVPVPEFQLLLHGPLRILPNNSGGGQPVLPSAPRTQACR